MTPPSRPHLTRFIRRAVEGMQRPPIFEADDGHEYVLKLDTLDPDFPAAELVGAMLGRAFDVPQPQFLVLNAPKALVDLLASTGDADLAEFAASFARQGGLVFGSRWLGGVTQKWTAAMRGIVADADVSLARLLVFDAFIENGDRSSATNPNLLVSNGQIYAIDHGQALPAVQGIHGKRLPYPFDSHLAWSVVRERPYLLDEPTAALRRLSDGAIQEAVAAVPAPWWTDAARPPLVVDELRVRRDILPGILEKLKESLA